MLTRTIMQIAIRHPNAVMAAGLAATFAREPGFEVRTWAPAIGGTQPGDMALGVVVTDVQTAIDLAASNAATRMRADAGPRLLAVGCASRGWQVRNAMERGVHGYVSDECGLDELIDAVRRVHNGERYLCASASRCIVDSLVQQALTPRELDVLRLVEEGLDNKRISTRLGIALGTVKSHVRTLLDKLDASSRTEAVAEGVKRGFIGA